MATSVKNNRSNRLSLSLAMDRNRTDQWAFSQGFPSDVVIQVGKASFNLHKFMLVAKSNYIRKIVLESKRPELTKIDLSDIPGGPEIFEKAAKFCYDVNFEVTVHNVAALRCAAEYLQMTDKYSDGNLISRTEEFLTQAALTSLSGAVAVLKSCETLLPIAEDLKIVQRCVNVTSLKACKEANFPTRLPPNWWTEELSILGISFFKKIISGMKSRGAKALIIATAIITYAETTLRHLVRDQSGSALNSLYSGDSDAGTDPRSLLESIVSLLPSEKAVLPITFLCCLLRSAIYLGSGNRCKSELERRVSAVLEHVTVDDLLVVSLSYDGERLFDLESVKRIMSAFVEKEKSVAVFDAGDFREVCSAAMKRVAKTVDAYLGEIATFSELSITKFNGIANLVPKGVRKVEDDLYRAIDIYLKAHPNLDEVEREKVCSIMDPLKLSYEARVHASQNKRLPVQIVLHALYYHQLKLRSSGVEENICNVQNAAAVMTTAKIQVQADVSLIQENEALRTELMKMKMCITDMQQKTPINIISSSTSCKGGLKRVRFFSSVSKTFGKLINPLKQGRFKDTSSIEDIVDITKPKERRFSIA